MTSECSRTSLPIPYYLTPITLYLIPYTLLEHLPLIDRHPLKEGARHRRGTDGI